MQQYQYENCLRVYLLLCTGFDCAGNVSRYHVLPYSGAEYHVPGWQLLHQRTNCAHSVLCRVSQSHFSIFMCSFDSLIRFFFFFDGVDSKSCPNSGATADSTIACAAGYYCAAGAPPVLCTAGYSQRFDLFHLDSV
jgi:hypothetical protein